MSGAELYSGAGDKHRAGGSLSGRKIMYDIDYLLLDYYSKDYCMSRKICPSFHNNSLYKNGQEFLVHLLKFYRIFYPPSEVLLSSTGHDPKIKLMGRGYLFS